MNVYDSDRMTDVLAPLGYAPTGTPDGADMVILNTCHIREKASEKVFSELGRLRMMKEKARDQQGRAVTIAVAGSGTQGGPSPGRCALNLSLRAQIGRNDPDLRHEADRYIRPGQFPCSEAGLTLCGPSWPQCASTAPPPGTSCSSCGG